MWWHSLDQNSDKHWFGSPDQHWSKMLDPELNVLFWFWCLFKICRRQASFWFWYLTMKFCRRIRQLFKSPYFFKFTVYTRNLTHCHKIGFPGSFLRIGEKLLEDFWTLLQETQFITTLEFLCFRFTHEKVKNSKCDECDKCYKNSTQVRDLYPVSYYHGVEIWQFIFWENVA